MRLPSRVAPGVACLIEQLNRLSNRDRGVTVVGPYTRVELGDGRSLDLYLLRIDKSGVLLSTRTQQAIIDAIADYSDVFVFSHGWNYTFDMAKAGYLEFIRGYAAQRRRLGLPLPEGYRPMLIGIVWPSTNFVLPWEQGPAIAAIPRQAGDEKEELLQLIGERAEPESFGELTELVDGVDALDGAAAHRAAELLLEVLTPGGEAEDPSTTPSADDLVRAWQTLESGSAPAPAPAGGFGTAVIPGQADPGPRPAGGVSLDPRVLLRLGSVWLMKDRAGGVGSRGVAPLLQVILNDTAARLHLIGHSFGARVLLSALTIQGSPRKAHSLLLLQPAVNRWCFADDVVGRGIPGGYRPVLDKVERPILTTFSRHDLPLHEAFHLAVRGSSLGEPEIAAVGDTERYGALGGYGPAGLGDRLGKLTVVGEGTPYAIPEGARVVQLDGDVLGVKVVGVDAKPDSPAISGHGDYNTTVTWWALHTLTEG